MLIIRLSYKSYRTQINNKDRLRDRKNTSHNKVFYLHIVMMLFDSWCRTISRSPAMRGFVVSGV